MNPVNFAMQTRCPHCLTEQYAMIVLEFSNGDCPCPHCGEYTQQMTYDQWYARLRAREQENR